MFVSLFVQITSKVAVLSIDIPFIPFACSLLKAAKESTCNALERISIGAFDILSKSMVSTVGLDCRSTKKNMDMTARASAAGRKTPF